MSPTKLPYTKLPYGGCRHIHRGKNIQSDVSIQWVWGMDAGRGLALRRGRERGGERIALKAGDDDRQKLP